ncbi:MAG: hypothetical protein V1679_00400 [Candidatus Peregrinibacteria bacterium]
MDQDIKNELNEIKVILKNTATKDNLRFFKNFFEEEIARLEEKMVTKDFLMDYLTMLDEIVKETRESRRSRLLFEGQFVNLDDTVNNHGKRIKVLEDKALQ